MTRLSCIHTKHNDTQKRLTYIKGIYVLSKSFKFTICHIDVLIGVVLTIFLL